MEKRKLPMTPKTILVLALGTCAMLIPMLPMSRQYRIASWKTLLSAVLLTITGTIGTYIWFIVENGYFAGRSFYGAVFLVPPVFFLLAKLLRVNSGELIDLCAPAECVMLTIMKYQCMRDGCCGGKVLCTTAQGMEVIFPSQIAEAAAALLIGVILLVMARNPKNRGTLFPWYMVIYGVSRFILNLFRAEDAVFLLGMTAGNVWSILSVILGLTWLILHKKLRKTSEE